MVITTQDMMLARRSALDESLNAEPPAPMRLALHEVEIDIDEHHPSREADESVPRRLVEEICKRLSRDGEGPGPGVAVVAGLAARFDVAQARGYHEKLFDAVWQEFRHRCADIDPNAGYKIKTGVIADGAVPLELYGSKWSFKQLHIDRDALLFSHLYGPVAGFTGGEVVVVDVRDYMARRKLRFDDVFEWSVEPTPGSKPVLQRAHHEAAMAESGTSLGAIDHDKVLFVNNSPSAGILHGAGHVEVTDQETFAREYHRCSAKGLPNDRSALQ